MYFNINFNVFFKLIKVHLLASELYIRMHGATIETVDLIWGYRQQTAWMGQMYFFSIVQLVRFTLRNYNKSQ